MNVTKLRFKPPNRPNAMFWNSLCLTRCTDIKKHIMNLFDFYCLYPDEAPCLGSIAAFS